MNILHRFQCYYNVPSTVFISLFNGISVLQGIFNAQTILVVVLFNPLLKLVGKEVHLFPMAFTLKANVIP